MTLPPTRPINDGSAFDSSSGKLFRFQGTDAALIEVMRLWPEPRAWRRYDGGPWRGDRPQIDLAEARLRGRVRPLTRRWRSNLRLAADRIPDEVRAIVASLSYRSQWRALSMMARVPGATDLFASNPALGVALAFPECFGRPVRRPLDAARRLVRRRRVEAMEWLGLPARRSAERVLRRLAPQDATPGAVRTVGVLLREQPRTLAHLPALHAPLLRLLGGAAPRLVLSPRLLYEIAALPAARAWPATATVDDVWVLREQLGHREPLRLRSRRHADAVRAELLEARQAVGALRSVVETFPPPPFPAGQRDEVVFEPVVRPEQLGYLGERLANCLADPSQPYARLVGQGNSYVYSLRYGADRRPRAVLHLARSGSGGRWTVSDLRAACNQPPPPGVERTVRAWLKDGQMVDGPWVVRHPSTLRWRKVWDVGIDRPDRRRPTDPNQLLLPLDWGGAPYLADDDIPF